MTPGLAAFTGVTLLLTLTPGVDTLLVTRSTLRDGRWAALLTTLGIATGPPSTPSCPRSGCPRCSPALRRCSRRSSSPEPAVGQAGDFPPNPEESHR